jgi:integrase
MKSHSGIYKRGNIYWITYMREGRQHFESVHSSRMRDATKQLKERKQQIKRDAEIKKQLKRDAEKQPRNLNEQPRRDLVSTPPSIPWTVDQLLNSYIAQIENPATRKRYKLSQAVLSPYCRECLITDIDAFAFDHFKETRLEEGVSPAGVNRDLALYRAAFNFGVERKLLQHSPLTGVRLFKENKYRKPPRTLSFAEEQRLLLCCDLRLRTIVVTLLDTGMRSGIEALRLKWADVDFEASEITVAQSKTAAGLRVIPMTARVKCELQKWHATTTQSSDYVFFNPQRPSTHIRSVKTAWHNALKVAGIPRLPIYQCRHTFATRLSAAGVSDTIIDQLLGHSRRDVLRFYTARVPEYLRDTISILDKYRRAKTELLKLSRFDAILEGTSKGVTVIN